MESKRKPNELSKPPQQVNRLRSQRKRPTNGWRDGRDPIQRWLRVTTTVVVLGVFVQLALDPSRRASGGDFLTLALALGAVLILLGYEGVVKLPGIGRGKNDRDDDD